MEKASLKSKVSGAAEEHPPQYTPNISQQQIKDNPENLHPVIVQVFISDSRTEVYYDQHGVWASKIKITKRAYVVDVNLAWSYETFQNNIRVSISESKERPTGFLAGAGIQIVKFEKLSVLWEGEKGNEDWTEVNEENYKRVLRLMQIRRWKDILRVTYKDLGPSPAKFAEKTGGEGGSKGGAKR